MHTACSGVLFDLDGVIADTESSITAFWHGVAAQHAVTLSPDNFKRHVYGVPGDHTLDALFSMLSPEERGRVHAAMHEHEITDTYSPVRGVMRFIRALHADGVPIAVVTSGMPPKTDTVLAQLGLSDLLIKRVTAADISAGKPHPDCYLLGAAFLSLPPEECLVFEDSVSGVEAAVAAGTTCIGVTDPERADLLLAAGASHVVPDFACVRYRSGIIDFGSGRPLVRTRSR